MGKAYISAREYRNIPVGYAAADVAENVDQQLAYFDCGPDGVRGDFFALNDYSWCDPTHSLEPDGTRRLSDTLAMAFQFSWPNSAASPTDETERSRRPLQHQHDIRLLGRSRLRVHNRSQRIRPRFHHQRQSRPQRRFHPS